MSDNFADWFKKFREQKKMSQAEMAELLGVTQGYLSKIEAKILQPSAYLLWALRVYVKININKVLDDL